jgi:hypothetical protein
LTSAACHLPGRASKLPGFEQRLVELSTLKIVQL